MTNQPVSNARRIVFTAMALFAFWVLAWNAYWIGCDTQYGLWLVSRYYSWSFHAAVVALSFSLVVLALLSIAAHNSPSTIVRDPLIWCCGFVFVCTLALCHGLGDYDAEVELRASNLASTWGQGDLDEVGYALWTEEKAAHQVSWFSLLLPIILTTAFVIFGAWRRAVRDAEVETVGEGE